MDLKYFKRHSKVLVCPLKKRPKTSLHAQLAHLLALFAQISDSFYYRSQKSQDLERSAVQLREKGRFSNPGLRFPLLLVD